MRGGSTEDRPGRWALWLGAVVVVALVALLARLGRRGLWLDEAVTWDIANGSLGELAAQVTGPEMNGASHYVVLWAWARLVPDTEAWLRIPSAIVAACAVAAVAHLARRRLGRGAGVAAGALLMSHVLWLSWGQQARQYSFVVAASAGALLAADHIMRSGSRRAWSAWALCSVVGAYSHLFVVPVALAQAGVLLVASPLASRRNALVPTAVAAIVCAPLVVGAAGDGGDKLAWIPPATLGRWVDVVATLFGADEALLAIPFVAATVAGLAVWQRADRRIGTLLAASIGVPPLAVAVAGVGGRELLVDRYLIGAVPAIVVACAGLWYWSRAVAATVAVVSIAASSVASARWATEAPDEDFRRVASIVDDERRPDETVVAWPTTAALALAPYEDDLGAPVVVLEGGITAPTPFLLVVRSSGATGPVPVDGDVVLEVVHDDGKVAVYRGTHR